MIVPDIPTVLAPLAALVPSDKNPNRMEPEKYADLVRAIRQEGFLQPILLTPLAREELLGADRYWIVDGHHRVEAARECGYTHVAAVVREMTFAQVRLLRMGMNRLRGELDLTVATGLLQELVAAGVPHDALWLSGFTPGELDGLLRAPETRADDFPAASQAIVEEPVAAERPFVLEVPFADRRQLVAVKRALRRAGGQSRDMALGLLSVLGLDE